MEAYNLYVRGRYFWRKRGRKNVIKSIQFLEQAVELDPDFALAYAGLADSYISLTFGEPIEKGIKIKEYAQKALELDDTLAEAHTALAGFKLDHEWDFKGAKQEFEKAIALNPGYATAHHWYGRYFWWIGDADKAIREMKLAQELDPLSPSINRSLAWSYIFAEQYDLALEALNRVLEIDPNHMQLHLAFGYFYLGKKNYDKALEEFIKAYGLDSFGSKYCEHYIWALKGETDKAREWIELVEEQKDLESISFYFIEIALLWAVLDVPDKVFFYLNNARENHATYMFLVQISPLLDSYRSDTRYDQLLRKMGLEK
jgi:tetratricopeptide (TPR) repeat protein